MPPILWSAPVPPAATPFQNMMLPPLYFTAGLMFKEFPHLSSRYNNGHYGQQFRFTFIRLQNVSKNQDTGRCLCMHLQTVICFIFCCHFQSNDLFFSEWPFSMLVPNVSQWIMTLWPKFFILCLWVDTHALYHDAHFKNPKPVSFVWQLHIPVVCLLEKKLFEQRNVAPSSGNCTLEWTRAMEVHSSSPDIMAALFWFQLN